MSKHPLVDRFPPATQKFAPHMKPVALIVLGATLLAWVLDHVHMPAWSGPVYFTTFGIALFMAMAWLTENGQPESWGRLLMVAVLVALLETLILTGLGSVMAQVGEGNTVWLIVSFFVIVGYLMARVSGRLALVRTFRKPSMEDLQQSVLKGILVAPGALIAALLGFWVVAALLQFALGVPSATPLLLVAYFMLEAYMVVALSLDEQEPNLSLAP